MLPPATTQIQGHTFIFTPEGQGGLFSIRPTTPHRALRVAVYER